MSLAATPNSSARTLLEATRERRRQKILKNADDRISKILVGYSGEMRQAPTIEGIMYGDSGDESARGKVSSRNEKSTVQERGDTVQLCQLTNFRGCFDNNRLPVTVLFGVLLRLLVHFDLVRSVTMIFLPVFIARQLFLRLRFSNGVTFSVQGSLLTNFLLVFGFNEYFVRLGALIFDIIWHFITDFCCTTLAFLVTNCLFIMLKYVQQFITSFL